jgi:hypothetical protein
MSYEFRRNIEYLMRKSIFILTDAAFAPLRNISRDRNDDPSTVMHCVVCTFPHAGKIKVCDHMLISIARRDIHVLNTFLYDVNIASRLIHYSNKYSKPLF